MRRTELIGRSSSVGQLAEPALGEQVEVADDAGQRRAQLVRDDRDELGLDLALLLELGVLRAQLRLGLGERARALADDLIEVRAQGAELGARVLDLARALLEHVAEAHRGVEQLGLGRRGRARALEARDQDVDRALRRRELALELGDALSSAGVVATSSRPPRSRGPSACG